MHNNICEYSTSVYGVTIEPGESFREDARSTGELSVSSPELNGRLSSGEGLRGGFSCELRVR